MSNPRFASDNAAGVHPAVLEALDAANRGPALAYGHDAVTERAASSVRRAFGGKADVLFVWGGTAANVLGLRTVVDSHHVIYCGEQSHLWSDECAAPENYLGCKLQPVPTTHAKLTPDLVRAAIQSGPGVHHAQPRALSIAQATEAGTVYSIAELGELAQLCRERGLLFHVDGARLANAAAALQTDLREVTADVGVDLVSFGGTKNGLMGAEAVVYLTPGIVGAAEFHRKQGMQLASKMRFVAAQFEALFTNDLWRENAVRANAAARRLEAGAAKVPQVEIVHPVDANAVFARIPRQTLKRLGERFIFHVWSDHPQRPTVRWMTAFDTTDAEVDEFLAALGEATG